MICLFSLYSLYECYYQRQPIHEVVKDEVLPVVLSGALGKWCPILSMRRRFCRRQQSTMTTVRATSENEAMARADQKYQAELGIPPEGGAPFGVP